MLALLLALTASADPVSETVRSGSVRDRVVEDDADLVIFYASEHRGNLGTCGCSVNPRGGLPRLAGYLEAVDRRGPGTPSVVVHAGWWASDRLAGLALHPAAERQVSDWVLAADQVGFDALNTTFRDTPALRELPVPDAALSTNAGEWIPPVQRVRAGDLDIAVLGVSRPGSPTIQPEAVSWSDPVEAVRVALEELEADLVVLLAFETGPQTEALARLEGVDVVIEAGGYPGKVDPWLEAGTVWVQSKDRGQALGELRLWLGAEGVSRVRDRWVDLDERIPEDRPLRRLQRKSDRARLDLSSP